MANDRVWRECDYDEAWAPFNLRFAFRPDFHERQTPAIELPCDALVLDLSPLLLPDGPSPHFAAGQASVNASALRAFVWLTEGEMVTALDWQHPAYRYSPAQHALSDEDWAVPVFPDGDYFVHYAPGLTWGTFGHPWQMSLTLWGDALTATLGAELLTWLPRHPHSQA